ncbi:hypothetical protein [Methylobacterium sp. CM6247]
MAAQARNGKVKPGKRTFPNGKGAPRPAVKPRPKPVSFMSDENVLPGIDVPDGIAKDASEFLRRSNANPERAADNHNELIGWLAERMTRVSKENRDHHYKTIAEAYAVYAAMGQTSSLRSAIVSAAKVQGITVNRRKTILRLLVELHISYTTDTDPRSLRQANKTYSRDVMAIESLIRQGTPPSDVLRLSREPKQGLDYWVRMSSPANKPREEKPAPDEVKSNETKECESDKEDKADNSQQEHHSNDQHRTFIERHLQEEPRYLNRLVWEMVTPKGKTQLTYVNIGSEFNDELQALFERYRQSNKILSR